jgi:hypothetical protein
MGWHCSRVTGVVSSLRGGGHDDTVPAQPISASLGLLRLGVCPNNGSMRGRAALWFSLGINVALAATLWRVLTLPDQIVPGTGPDPGDAVTLPVTVRTNVVVRRENFVWNQIESEDYPTYIANLRAIGCPEPTIRDIIVAEVTQHFARRRATEVITGAQQWWRFEPDPEIAWAAIDQVRALEDERRALLTRLLGPDWESADYPMPSIETLAPMDGPILGNLPPETRLAVQQIERIALERQQEYLASRQSADLAPDPYELARLRQQTRDELAEILDPEAFEEYLLRFSHEAAELRRELRAFDPSPEEFRALFLALDPLDWQLLRFGSDPDPVTASRRRTLEQEREKVVQRLLAPERIEQYQLSQDPLYQQARDVARRAGVSDDQILPLTAIYGLMEVETQRIRNDPSLSLEEQAEQLEAARLAHENSLRELLGDEAYRQSLERQSP